MTHHSLSKPKSQPLICILFIVQLYPLAVSRVYLSRIFALRNRSVSPTVRDCNAIEFYKIKNILLLNSISRGGSIARIRYVPTTLCSRIARVQSWMRNIISTQCKQTQLK
jgi:hypothetical protein